MSGALCVLGSCAVLTWLCPPLLTRLTRSGLSPRLSIAVWLGAVATVLGAWVVTSVGLVVDVATGAPIHYCLDAIAAAARAGIPGRLAVFVAGAAALVLSVLILRRITLSLRRFLARSRTHADDVRILGSASAGRDVVVVAAERPAAYCVAGRPHAIVVTTGALASLDHDELAAVLAHERAHLAGRHLQLMMVLRALAGAMPHLPLFGSAVSSVGRLVEMRADDVAARRHGRHALLRGLVALAAQPRLTGNALGAADTAAFARADRLATAVPRGVLLRLRIALTATLALLITAPYAVAMICHW